MPTINPPTTIEQFREVGFIPQMTRDKNPVRSPVLSKKKTKNEHPVFGHQPHQERDLVRQGVCALFFYYWKASCLLDEAGTDVAETERRDLIEARDLAFEAMLKVKPISAAEAARQMEVVAAEMRREGTVNVLGPGEFNRLADNLKKITKPILPTKMPGKLTVGKRLTKVGLLHRYCSFLLEELNTISWELYGERDYLLHIHFYDDAVRARLRGNPRRHPFFNPAGMNDRATRVLKSLKIDTVNASHKSQRSR